MKAKKSIQGTHIKTGETITFESQYQASKQGFIQPSLSACLNGYKGTHRGYEWFFTNEEETV
jgi:hypothetical protein